jgi:hypothetical protein
MDAYNDKDDSPEVSEYLDGYAAGYQDGKTAYQDWLREDLATLADDLRLGLRHDIETPLDVLTVITVLLTTGEAWTDA